MTESLFDPSGFFQFNMASGQVRTTHDRRALVVTEQLLMPLVGSAVQNGDLKVVRQFGRELGEEVLSSLGKGSEDKPFDVVLSHMSSVLALMGFGKLTLQRWGQALVADISGLPLLDSQHLAAAALLGGIFSVVSQREVACVPVGRDGKFVVVDPSVAEQVWNWSNAGDSVGEITSRLESKGSA